MVLASMIFYIHQSTLFSSFMNYVDYDEADCFRKLSILMIHNVRILDHHACIVPVPVLDELAIFKESHCCCDTSPH